MRNIHRRSHRANIYHPPRRKAPVAHRLSARSLAPVRSLPAVVPSLAVEILPDLATRLSSRVTARFLREVVLDPRDVAAADEALAKAKAQSIMQQNGGFVGR